MLSTKEIKKWLLENCVDGDGDLDLSCLDFSDFNGNVNISSMRVKNNLYQHFQKVDGDLHQDYQTVKKGTLYQGAQEAAYIDDDF